MATTLYLAVLRREDTWGRKEVYPSTLKLPWVPDDHDVDVIGREQV
jgi:hypothetical protein